MLQHLLASGEKGCKCQSGCHVSLATFISMIYKIILLTACSLHAELIKIPDTSRDVHVADSLLHLSLFADTDMLPWQRPLLATS